MYYTRNYANDKLGLHMASTEEDVAYFKRLFRYEGGTLIRKVTTSSRAFAGDSVGCENNVGYLQVSVKSKPLYVHRIIWEMHNGPIPEGMEIDHINQVRTDNRIENLRLVSHQGNLKNQSMNSGNTSGHAGVSWFKRGGKWRATIKVGGRQIHIGYFASFESAVAARKAAEKQYGFHDNHGAEKKK